MSKRYNPPESVKVLNAIVAVKPMTEVEASKRNVLGLYYEAAQEMYVKEGMAKGMFLEVVIHELFHAIWAGMMKGKQKAKEEQAVGAMAKGLATVLIDNPDLGLWIKRMTDGK